MADHHGDKRQATFDTLRGNLLNTASFRGALGTFPNEGMIQFAIAVDGGRVVVDFGTPVHWMALSPQQAADLASHLLVKAREAGRAAGQPVTFTIA